MIILFERQPTSAVFFACAKNNQILNDLEYSEIIDKYVLKVA